MATAGVTHEVVLDGVGYMLAAGKEAYLCAADGGRNGTTASNAVTEMRRWVFEEWSGEREGQLQNLRPVFGGKAAVLTPAQRLYIQAGTPSDNTVAACQHGGQVYFSIGPRLYRLAADANRLFTSYVDTGLSLSGTAVYGLTSHDGLLWIATGTKLYTWDTVTLTDVTATYGTASFVAGYNGVLFWANGNYLSWRVAGTNFNRALPSSVTALLAAAGSLWIGARGGLFRLSGQLKAGNPATSPATLNLFEPSLVEVLRVEGNVSSLGPDANFAFTCAAHGYLWFWVNGRVGRMKFSEAAGPASAQVETQLPFGRLRGMNVCEGLVVVALDSNGLNYLWAWGPEQGWFLLDTGGLSSQNFALPFTGLPVCKDAAVCVPVLGAFHLGRYPLDNANPAGRNPQNFGLADASSTGYVLLPDLSLNDFAGEAGEGNYAVAARLLAVGVEWGIPGELNDWADLSIYAPGGGSAGQVTLDVGISTNAGASFTFLGGYAPQSINEFRTGQKRWTLTANQGEAVTPGGVNPAHYRLMVKVSGPNAPALRRVWLDYKVERLRLATGREWKLKFYLGDPAVTLNLQGPPGSSSVAAALSALRNLWDGSTTVDFYDVDGSGPYRVKMVGLRLSRSGSAFEAAVVLKEVSE